MPMLSRQSAQGQKLQRMRNRLHCHATADEVYEEIIQEYPTISKATVYRNLNLLSEMGEIRRLEIPGFLVQLAFRCGSRQGQAALSHCHCLYVCIQTGNFIAFNGSCDHALFHSFFFLLLVLVLVLHQTARVLVGHWKVYNETGYKF